MLKDNTNDKVLVALIEIRSFLQEILNAESSLDSELVLIAKGGALRSFVCFPNDEKDGIYINEIIVKGNKRGNGLGSNIMTRVVAICDKRDLAVDLDAMPISDHDAETRERLLSFYERLGFEAINDYGRMSTKPEWREWDFMPG